MSGVDAQIARLARAFPRQEIVPSTYDVYVAELADVPAALLERAVTEIVRTSEWFPTVAAIRAACAEATLALVSASGALAQIDERIRWAREREGAAPPVQPLVLSALARVGGFAAFRTAESGIVKGQFTKTYNELRAAAIRDAQLGPALEPSRGRELGS